MMFALVFAMILVMALVGGVGLVMVVYNRILYQRKRALGIWNILDRLRQDRHDRARILVDIAFLSLPGAAHVLTDIQHKLKDARLSRGFDVIMHNETELTIAIDNLRAWLDQHPAERHVSEFEQAFYDVNMIEDTMAEQEAAYNDCVTLMSELMMQRIGSWVTEWFSFRPFQSFYCIDEPPLPPMGGPEQAGGPAPEAPTSAGPDDMPPMQPPMQP